MNGIIVFIVMILGFIIGYIIRRILEKKGKDMDSISTYFYEKNKFK